MFSEAFGGCLHLVGTITLAKVARQRRLDAQIKSEHVFLPFPHPMRYRSTRDPRQPPELLSFEETLFRGLAPDGGLYLPATMPVVSATQLAEWKSLSFPLLACRIFRLYIEEREISNTDLESLLIKSFSTFSHPEVAPLSKLVDGRYLLELFHGPTFAFKGTFSALSVHSNTTLDVALQVVGLFLPLFTERKSIRILFGQEQGQDHQCPGCHFR